MGFHACNLDDVLFFASLLNPQVVSKEELQRDVDNDPIPYMLLNSGAGGPIIHFKREKWLIHFSQYRRTSFDIDQIKKPFKTDEKQGVLRVSFARWSEAPHQAAIYFDKKGELLTVISQTEKGFFALIEKLNATGINVDTQPQMRVHFSMMVTMQRILQKKFLLPYEELFWDEVIPVKPKKRKK